MIRLYNLVNKLVNICGRLSIIADLILVSKQHLQCLKFISSPINYMNIFRVLMVTFDFLPNIFNISIYSSVIMVFCQEKGQVKHNKSTSC